MKEKNECWRKRLKKDDEDASPLISLLILQAITLLLLHNQINSHSLLIITENMKFQAATCAAVLLLGVLNSASGYSSGAPNDPEICKSMRPKHPGAPQNEASPYGLSVDRTNVKPGDRVTLTINSPSMKKFKGFLVQGRNSDFDKNTTPVGTFIITDGTKGNACDKIPDSSITHAKNDEIDMVNVTWVAPEKPGTYVLLATIVQDGLTYWIRQPSQTITVA